MEYSKKVFKTTLTACQFRSSGMQVLRENHKYKGFIRGKDRGGEEQEKAESF